MFACYTENHICHFLLTWDKMLASSYIPLGLMNIIKLAAQSHVEKVVVILTTIETELMAFESGLVQYRHPPPMHTTLTAFCTG